MVSAYSEAFLKNPLTNKVGKALAIHDYDRARELIPDLQSRVGPDSYDAFITSIKATICDSLCQFKPQANRSDLLRLPLVNFILKWEEIYSGDRDVNQRLRDNMNALSCIHLVNDGVLWGFTRATKLQQLIRDDHNAIPHMRDTNIPYYVIFPHMLRPYGNKINSLDADFYRDLNECKINDDKIRFLQARSDLILKEADQIDAAISERDPVTSRRTNSHKNNRGNDKFTLTHRAQVHIWDKCMNCNYRMLGSV